MIAYLIKSTICLLVLLIVYHLLLEREKMHRFNRYFLLFGLVFSFTIPFLTLEITSEPVSVLQLTNRIEVLSSEPANYSPAPKFKSDEITKPIETSNITFLLIVYVLGASITAFRLSRNLYLLYSKIKSNPQISNPKGMLILVEDCGGPHSFFKYIFVDEQLYRSGNIDEAVFKHEQTHVRQKHSVDILFIELLKIAFWFNPVLYFYKKAIQLNHEYLADDLVISDYADIHGYQRLLLKLQSGEKNMRLSSSIQYSITKKRIMMMTKNTTRLRSSFKKLALVPVMAALLFAFSIRTAPAQQVQSMSITELMDAVYEKMVATDTLSAEEQEALSSLVEKMRNMLIEKYNKRIAPPPPMPPQQVKNAPPPKPSKINSPAPPNASQQEINKFNELEEKYQTSFREYMNIDPVGENEEKLKNTYQKVINLVNKYWDLYKKVSKKHQDKPLPPPPVLVPDNPSERMETHSKIDSTQLK